MGVEGIDGLKSFVGLANCIRSAAARCRGPESLHVFYGFIEKRGYGLVDVAIGVGGKSLRDLCSGEVGLCGGLQAGTFCSFFLIGRRGGSLLDALLEVEQPLHVGIVGGLIVFLLYATPGRDNLLRGLNSLRANRGLRAADWAVERSQP